MLRIAVPNKGSLHEAAVEMLRESGYKVNRRGKELVLVDNLNDVELFLLRPRDIAVYVGKGTIQVGITGRDLLLDSGAPAVEFQQLGFAKSKFRFAAPAGKMSELRDIEGKRVASSYDHLVKQFLEKEGVDAEVVHLDGAVESSIQLGVADVIADVVETGSTLRAAGLEVFGPILLQSEAILIGREEYRDDPQVKVLQRRLDGVMRAHANVLVDYNVHERDMAAAVAVAPGFESPTISPLADSSWLAVRVVVPRGDINRVMDELYDAGARGILVTELSASRL
ncbi:ATP phosphoribosyltransferase [Actinomyces sp.]|uniref:ATP phosphoribosyltransferase n=1 Tax=Actinomyces sp. TaxID=29317 RepID=UPI001ED59245|nr:ATP phosphoribosyltransferase [Actinomyces sp.]MBS5826428.1 ATP phosphoribosyltransferase [Actinomyces sp.]MDU5568028.1 ATP phosphoribosyltransferase [Actinomyces sp.]MDU6679611.1 ATP phosphoribosyltransferase [Actinomyces sp.]